MLENRKHDTKNASKRSSDMQRANEDYALEWNAVGKGLTACLTLVMRDRGLRIRTTLTKLVVQL